MAQRAKKAKQKVDYRHRWPTQQTLVDSRASLPTLRFKWRWGFRVGWLRRLKRRSSPEPGKSTHPYDTGVGERGGDSGSGSGFASMVNEDGQGCLGLFSRMSQPPTSPAPVPKFSHIKERPETPKTPVQFLRHLTSPKKSPLPRPRTASSFDCDKPTVKCTKCTVQTPDLPPKVAGPVAKRPKVLSVKFKSWVKNVFRRRGTGRRRTARQLAGHDGGDRQLTPVRVRRLQ
ncbi:hypothetical protein ANO14919_032180 [Xylariales sp. No.14919]|nr:hypothetical protein ANO14919_032180 [Xylariales sp. No.14919]